MFVSDLMYCFDGNKIEWMNARIPIFTASQARLDVDISHAVSCIYYPKLNESSEEHQKEKRSYLFNRKNSLWAHTTNWNVLAADATLIKPF